MLTKTSGEPESPLPDSEPTPKNSKKSFPRAKWHLIYFVLALFDVLAISGSLYLNHKIVSLYMSSVAENEKWNNRLIEYSKVWQIASDVNAPGNNVFDNHDVETEEALRNKNLEVFNDTLAKLKNDLKHDVQTEEAHALQTMLQKVSTHMGTMINESDMIFSLFRQGEAGKAGKRMAIMDRKYAMLNSSLINLNLKVGAIAQKHFEHQVQSALFLKQFEYLFGGIVIFMVVGVTLYGNMVARKVRAAEDEKETYLSTLEKNKIDLEEFAASLEDAWSQAQQYNHELMDANKRLHTEVDHRKTMQAKNEILLLKLETKNNELTEFTSIASHDLQEPLRKIIVFGDRMRSLLKEDDEKSNQYLDRIQKASMRMSNLIQALLDLSHIHKDSRPFTQIDLNEVVQEVTEDLELQIKETGGKIEVPPLPVIRANRTQMQQLFQNLISNSLKFSKEDTFPEIRLIYSSTPNQHEIVIQDNGIGFDEKYALRIFKPFERLNAKMDFEGTGIGLAICEKIIQNHRGSIQARSQVNQGASFVIVFPKDVS